MTTTKTPTTLSIVLSDEGPVCVKTDDWPTIAETREHSGEHKCQALEILWIKVRRHADGRRIVYGMRDYGPGGSPFHGYRPRSAGYLLAADASEAETVRAIRRVAGVIGDDQLGDDAIAALPARDL